MVLCGVYELALESASFFLQEFFFLKNSRGTERFFLSLYSFFSRGKNIYIQVYPGLSWGIKIGVVFSFCSFFLFYFVILLCW